MKLRVVLPASIAASALFLGACSSSTDHSGMDMGSESTMMDGMGGGAGSSTTAVSIPADADYNATDVAFAQGMIVHHGQAVMMAEMALDQADNPEVVTLATAIKAAQDPEIAEMSGWLENWGVAVPDPMSGMDHEMGSMGNMMMSGMMSDEDMAKLENASGVDFDRMFLEMMVKHHTGAIEMAQTEVADGKYQPAKALATNVITTQQDEIDQMNALLATLPA